jgi:ribokinase
MRVAVVGHIEWIRFCRVDSMPVRGEIAHSVDDWEQVGGGGAVAAIQLARLGAETLLFTAIGDDELGRRSREELEAVGVRVHAETVRPPQRWAFTHVDDTAERTITTVGRKLRARGNDEDLPWHELATAAAVFFVAGDEDALGRARRARVLVATTREIEVLRRGGVQLDALVGSGRDEAERYQPGQIDPAPDLVVSTSGSLGGWSQPGGPFAAAPVPGPVVDSYGAGDCFAAGLTFALGAGEAPAEAIAFAAKCGAAALTGQGVAPQVVALD